MEGREERIPIQLLDGAGNLLKEIELSWGQDLTFGSSPNVDIVLEPLEEVYPEHCRISARGETVVVQNLSIIGKVYLNGQQVEFRPLNAGDVIGMGPYQLRMAGEAHRVLVEPEPRQRADAPEPDMVSSEEPSEAEVPEGLEGEQSVDVPPPEEVTVVAKITKAQLIWMSPDGLRVFDLREAETVVGRGEFAGIVIDDPEMSREHFKLQERDGSYYLIDLSSENGTRVNGVRIVETQVYDSDEIEAGRSRFKVALTLREALGPFEEEPREKTKVVEFLPPKPKGPPKKKPKWYEVRRNQFVILVVLGFLLVAVFVFEPEPEPEPEKVVKEDLAPPPVIPKDPWDLLTEEQQKEIEENYSKAQKLMARGAWEEAYVLLRKIQDYGIPYKNVEALIKRAQRKIIAGEEKLYLEEQRSAEKERRELISQYLKEGKLHLERGDFESARESFANVLELDPLNEQAIRGLEAARSKEEDIDFKERERQIKEANERRVSEYYSQVVAKIDQNEFDEARSLIKKRLTLIPYTTDHWDFKFEEARQLSHQREFEFYQPQIEQAQVHLQQGEWRQAWRLCNMVVKRNPTLKEAQACRKKADTELQNRSRKLYQDAIVSESLGNLTDAKEKWRQILNISPPYDIYYTRAVTKLDLYK